MSEDIRCIRRGMAASGKRSVRDVLSWVCVVSLSRTASLFTVLPCTFHLVWQGRLVRLVQCDWLWSVCRRCAVHLSGCALVRLVLLCWRGRGLSVQSCICTVAILAQGTSWAVAVTQAFLQVEPFGAPFARDLRGHRAAFSARTARPDGSAWHMAAAMTSRYRGCAEQLCAGALPAARH